VAATTYNPAGQVTAQQLDVSPNGLTRQYVYETNTLRLSVLKAGTASPWENLQQLTYGYDNAGNVRAITDTVNSGQAQTFDYDWLHRLTSAATNAAGVGQYSHTYAYNAIGNITSYDGNAYTYGAKPHAVTAAFGNAYGYDAVGNQTTRTISGVAYTQTFDYDNRLIEVKQGATSLATFLYDADGNRVKGTVGSVTTVYIAGVYEYQNGAVTKYYEGGAFRRTGYASYNGVFYALQDHLRSTSVLVNQNGTVNSRNYYYPYGGNRGGGAFSGLTTKRFMGQYQESSLPGGEGLYYYNARWYDARLARFVSADTIVLEPGAPPA
jgi:RHS repeat-associated protein